MTLKDKKNNALTLNSMSLEKRQKLLALAKKKGLKRNSSEQIPPILPASSTESDEAPLSFSQQRLWFLARLDEAAKTAYIIAGDLELHGNINRAALQNALNQIMLRHDILRTGFFNTPLGVVQKVSESVVEFPLDYCELNDNESVPESFTYDFDFEKPPLVRAQLLKIAEHTHLLRITMHHIISDGWSLNIFLQELGGLYSAYVSGQTYSLPELSIQYADYARWQNRWIQNDFLKQQKDYWVQRLQDAPALIELPLDKKRPKAQDYKGATYPFSLSLELSQSIQKLAQQCNTTPFVTLMTLWSALLGKLAGQDDLVVGTPIANRHREGVDQVIGIFINTIALRINVDQSASVRSLISQVRQIVLEAQDYQDIPFEQVVAALDPDRSLSYSPVFQVMFDWQENTEQNVKLSGLDCTIVATDQQTAQFDISLSMYENDGCILGLWEYATALFDEATVARTVEQFIQLLTFAVQNPEASVKHCNLVTSNERHTQLSRFSGPARTYPGAPTLHQRFEAIAERLPTHCAAVHNDQQMDYQTLDRRSNQVAQTLLSQGVQRGQLVAIHCPRSIEFLIGILGTLKAGAAYVPLDPNNPPERLNYMVAQAQ
uniref:condensation domain-containing protein n=1 Tax=Gynuella sp. TaxID=2969146 RepID=UPI003D09E6D8